MAKPSFMKKALDDNAKQREVIKKSINGERFAYMGDPALQWSTGGYMRGGLNLLTGPSKSGKSTLAMKWAAQEQAKKGGIVVIIDTENAYIDPEERNELGELSDGAKRTRKRFEDVGLDVENVLLWKTNQSAEVFTPLVNMEPDLVKDPTCVAAVVIDSWEGIENAQQANKIDKGKTEEVGNSFGGNAKSINPILKRLIHLNIKYGLTVFSVQHVRSNMEMYGPKYLIPGGQTFIHLHNMILLIEGSETKNNSLVEGDEQGNSAVDTAFKVGKLIRAQCIKSRAVVEGRTSEFFINFMDAKFALKEQSLFTLATRLNLIVHPVDDKGKENTRWWQYPAHAENPMKFNGAKGFQDALSADKELFTSVFEACMTSQKLNASSAENRSVGIVSEDGKVIDIKDLKDPEGVSL